MKIKGVLILGMFVAFGILGNFHIKTKKKSKQTKKILFSLKEGFSENVAKSLLLFAKEQEKMSCSHPFLVSLIKDSFPSIDKIVIQSGKNNEIKVKVTPHVPLLVVNDVSFFTKSGNLVAVSDYHKKYHFNVPSIVIKQKTKEIFNVSSVCKRFIYHCPVQLMKEYAVTWHSPTTIALQNKEDKKFTVLVHNETNISEQLLKRCKQVHQEALQKNTSKHKQHWIDVRFKNQIIIRSEWEELG